MYYRRKIILGLIEAFEGRLNKTSFQKLLLIFSKLQDKPSYEFVPYKYGCFSFQSYADLRTMIKYDLVAEENFEDKNEEFWVKVDSDKYQNQLKSKDAQLIQYLKSNFAHYSTEDLVKYTYKKYPYYAIHSTIANKILSLKEQKEINKYVSTNQNRALYTIGYEGISQEAYLNKLIKNNIKFLCDVRKNPLSMKYGFSKNQLKKACAGLGINYLHIPELGIESSKRKQLKNQCDYDLLFEGYNSELSSEKSLGGIAQIENLLETYNRVAITCFEANIHQCHRKHLAQKIHTRRQEFQIIHI